MNSNTNLYQAIPSVDKILQSELLQEIIQRVGRQGVKKEIGIQLESLRKLVVEDPDRLEDLISGENLLGFLCKEVEYVVSSKFSSTLVPVFNLTGTVIHTNLGRAKLPQEAIDAMQLVSAHATNLEFDLETGMRGDRDTHLEESLCEITGAEAATVVNNNAAAVLLVLNTLAAGKEVIISRGELVEIGGAFRIPEVMESANCTLKEIGTTNRTHLKDYESAINTATALLMKVHTSNYEIRGFTNSVTEAELSDLAKSRDLPFISDLGSGTLIDLKQFNLPNEPTVKQVLEAGADLVTFSGDKLLGGPQAGIIVGSKELIQAVKSNPLKRALRVDKVTLAALVAVINLYKDPQRISSRLPLLADLTRPESEIKALADKLLPSLTELLKNKAEIRLNECKSQIGSGALPLDLIGSTAIVLTPIAEKGDSDASLVGLAAAFRRLPKPVIGRIHDGSLLFDVRCLRVPTEFINQLSQLDF